MTNVCLIVVDALRARNLPEWGYHRMTAPNMQQFFDQSIVYRNAFSQHNYTTPSVTCLLTGKYYFEHGIWQLRLPTGVHAPVKRHVPTIADILKKQGTHKTIMINEVFTSLFDREGVIWKSGFNEHPSDYSGHAGEFVHPDSGVPVHPVAKQTTDKALEYLDGDDFFMYVHYWDVHRPFVGEDGKKYYNEFYEYPFYEDWATFLRSLKDEASRQHAQTGGLGMEFPVGNNRDLNLIKAYYDSEIKYTDYHVGRLIRALPKDTFVVLTADHAESMGEHGKWFCHGEADLFNEVIHVPLAYRFPIKEHQTPDEYIRITEFGNVENKSVFDAMLHFANGGEDYYLNSPYVYSCGRIREDGGIVDSLIKGNLKMMMRNFGQEEYGYNLAADPLELYPITTLGNENFFEVRQLLRNLASQSPP